MGRPKKTDDERVRRNKPGYIQPSQRKPDLPEWDGVTRGPELPLFLPGIKWSTMTIKWWDVWRNSSQAMDWCETDWQFAMDTALLYNEFWTPRLEQVTGVNGKLRRERKMRSPSDLKTLAAEIRTRTAVMGATVKDRKLNGLVIENDSRGVATDLGTQIEEAVPNYAQIIKDAGL